MVFQNHIVKRLILLSLFLERGYVPEETKNSGRGENIVRNAHLFLIPSDESHTLASHSAYFLVCTITVGLASGLMV